MSSFWLSLPIAVALSAAPERPAVRLELEAGLPCRLNATLPISLTQQDVKVAADGARAGWIFSARSDGDAVLFRLMTSASVLVNSRRLNPTPSDCSVLPRATAVLVKSWLATQLDSAAPSTAPDAPALYEDENARPSRSSSGAVEPLKTAPVVTAALAADSPSGEGLPSNADKPAPSRTMEAPPESEPLQLIAPPNADGAQPHPFPTSPPVVDVAAPHANVQPTTQTLSVMLAGGGALSPQDSPVGTARLSLEWGFFEPWAVALDAGFQSMRSNTTPYGGTVQVSLQCATLSARRSFLSSGVDGLHVLIGAQLIRLEATAQGFTTNTSADVFTGGAVVSVEGRKTLAAGLFVLARLNFQGRSPKTFSIQGVGTLVTVPALAFGLEAGLGWNFL